MSSNRKNDYANQDPHELSGFYERLSKLEPITDDGRALDIATWCDGDNQSTISVRYGYGPRKADH